jgi:VTC domain-containing protein
MSRLTVTTGQRGFSAARRATMVRTDWRYEMKFRVSDGTADQAIAWARACLEPDPHADPALEDGYHISSLYFDTPALTVFHRIGPDRRRKYRVRRYGSESLLYLERKLKSRGRVRKYRSWIPDDEISLLEDDLSDREWSGDWFRRRIQTRSLEPVCQVSYQRVARVGALGGQPVRLSVDRQLHASCAGGLCLPAGTEGIPLLAGEAVLELKFPRVLPQEFKQLVRDLSLVPSSVSKYRIAMASCGLQSRFDSTPGAPIAASNGRNPEAARATVAAP